MSARRRWTRWRASRRRSASRAARRGPRAGRRAGSSSASSERNASSLPLCGVAVTRTRWRFGSLAERLEQLVALVAAAVARAEREGVRLVDDHELGAGAHEVLAAAVGLDEVGRDDDVRVLLEERAADRQAALEALRGRGQHELGVRGGTSSRSSPCHCSARCGGQSTARRCDVAAVEQLAGDQRGLDRLADADVVGDQQPHRDRA